MDQSYTASHRRLIFIFSISLEIIIILDNESTAPITLLLIGLRPFFMKHESSFERISQRSHNETSEIDFAKYESDLEILSKRAASLNTPKSGQRWEETKHLNFEAKLADLIVAAAGA